MGFDDIALATNVYPPLTTVHQYGETIGETAVHILLGQIEEESFPKTVRLIDVDLVVRKSSVE